MDSVLMDIPQYDGIGIYALIDDAGKMYIGSSINVKRRLAEHSKGLANGKEHKSLVDAVEQGRQFRCEILEKIPYGCNTYHLREREHFYITKYDTVKSGYNTAFPTCAIPQDIESNPLFKGSAIAKAIHDKHSKPILKPVKQIKPIKEKLDEIKIRVPAGGKENIKKHAEKAGKSVNQYIVDAVTKEMLLDDEK